MLTHLIKEREREREGSGVYCTGVILIRIVPTVHTAEGYEYKNVFRTKSSVARDRSVCKAYAPVTQVVCVTFAAEANGSLGFFFLSSRGDPSNSCQFTSTVKFTI